GRRTRGGGRSSPPGTARRPRYRPASPRRGRSVPDRSARPPRRPPAPTPRTPSGQPPSSAIRYRIHGWMSMKQQGSEREQEAEPQPLAPFLLLSLLVVDREAPGGPGGGIRLGMAGQVCPGV